MDEKTDCSGCGKPVSPNGAEILGLSNDDPKIQRLCWECGLKSMENKE